MAADQAANDADDAQAGERAKNAGRHNRGAPIHAQEAKEGRLNIERQWSKGEIEIFVRCLALQDAPAAVEDHRLVEQEHAAMASGPGEGKGEQCGKDASG